MVNRLMVSTAQVYTIEYMRARCVYDRKLPYKHQLWSENSLKLICIDT